MDPPQTPWVGLPRFQDVDESLLINAQPIFEDSFNTTKGDGDGLDDWVQNTYDTVWQTERDGVDISLDLGDYLPGEEDHTQKRIVVRQQTSTREDGEILGQENMQAMTTINNRKTSHKRVGSQSLIPIAVPSKKTKPPIPKEKIDDLYTRRLSDSVRRNSTTNVQNLHASLTSAQFQSHIPQASSSNLYKTKETASLGSRASLHIPPVLNEKKEARGFGVDGHIQKHTSFRRIPQIQEKILSRGLTRSSNIQPSRQPSIETSSTSGDIPRRDGSADQDGVQTLSNQLATQHLPSVTDHEKFTAHRQPSPFSLASTTSEMLSSHSRTSEIKDSSSNSRRSSMSEKVVRFLSNLLSRSISSSSLRDQVMSSKSEKGVEGKEDDRRATLNHGIDQAEDIAVVCDHGDHEEEEGSSEQPSRLQSEKRIHSYKAESPTNRVSAKHTYPIVPLTKPIPFSRPLHTQPDIRSQSTSMVHPKSKPLQPSRSANINVSSPSSIVSKGSTSTDRKNPYVITSTGTRSIINRPVIKSAFASAALAKLPPPGKGHSTSLSTQPVIVKSTERVRDLKERKSVFERLSEPSSDSNSNSTDKKDVAHPRPSRAGMNLTVPIRGHTPGKASDMRSKQRAEFDATVHAKFKEKEKQQEELKKRKEQEEEEEYQRKRKETVIWSKPVPDMYKR
ncbi:hypothetical protein V865_001575 [Kwoniella europaea PYCC6329]|uniref:TPX2 C-terminal domain-containing protein n=1 Tax=Kwoniella europaea PYCC6329 TaxID=1423913 RepID=A0AAX4KAM3_9TREE